MPLPHLIPGVEKGRRVYSSPYSTPFLASGDANRLPAIFWQLVVWNYNADYSLAQPSTVWQAFLHTVPLALTQVIRAELCDQCDHWFWDATGPTLDLGLSSQLQSISAIWLVPNYTKAWQCKPQGQHWPPQVISTGRCQHIWPTYAVIGWLTKTRTDALLWLV